MTFFVFTISLFFFFTLELLLMRYLIESTQYVDIIIIIVELSTSF